MNVEYELLHLTYEGQPLEVNVEYAIHSKLEALWNNGKYPKETQHINAGYSIWTFVHSLSEIAQQPLQNKFLEDCNILMSKPAAIKESSSNQEDDLRLADNLNNSFADLSFLSMTQDARLYMQNYYERFLFLPCLSVVTDFLQEYKKWRSNLKPHDLSYSIDILVNRNYSKTNLFQLFYDYCEGNILTNVFIVMKRHNENPIMFDNYYEGIIDYRKSDSVFREIFDKQYSSFRKRHRGDDTNWDFSFENEYQESKISDTIQEKGNGLVKYISMMSIQSWKKLYNLLAPCSNGIEDTSHLVYFFPRTQQTQECWMNAYHGTELTDPANKIGWHGSAFTLHAFISLLCPNEQPAEACWPVVAKYFCNENNPKMWSAKTLQKSTFHKGKDNDEPYVAKLKAIIDNCKE